MKWAALLLLPIGALVMGAVFALWRIDCPGLYYDEVLFVHGWDARVPCVLCPNPLPIMSMPYLGAIKTWLYWPWGDRLSPALVRIPPLALAAVSIGFAAGTVGRVSGPTAAALAATLLAVDPAFVFYQRLDWGPVALGIFCRAVSLFLLMQWRERGGDRWLVAAAFVLGAGVYDKLLFAWFIVALALAILATRSWWPRPAPRTLTFAGLAFALGAAPLIAFNLTRDFATLREPSFVGAVESIPGFLRTRAALLTSSLDGSALYHLVNQASLGDSLPCPGLPAEWRWLCGSFAFEGTWLVALLVIAVTLTAVVPNVRADPGCRFLAIIVVATGLIMVPIARLGPHHVPVVFPCSHMLIAVVVTRWAARGRSATALAAAAVTALIVSQVAVSGRTAVSFAGLCGRGPWSPAIYELARFAKAHPEDRIIVGDWGMYTQLRTLAPGARLVDASWPSLDGRAAIDLFDGVTGHRTYVLLHHRDTTIFPEARAKMLAALRDGNLSARRSAVFRDLDGRPTAYAVEIRQRLATTTPLTSAM